MAYSPEKIRKSKENPQYISLAKAGIILNTSGDYLNVLVRRGKLHAVKLGRNWFTTSQWVEDYQKKPIPVSEASVPYVSLSEAGKVLGTSRDYINVLIHREKLHAVKLGRNWFTTSQWLNDYQKNAGRPAVTISKGVNLPSDALARAEKSEFENLKAKIEKQELAAILQRIESKVESISSPKESPVVQTFKDKEVSKKVSTLITSQEIQLPSRLLASDEKSKILETVKERIRITSLNQFQEASKKLGIFESLKSWSTTRLSIASGLTGLLLIVSLGMATGILNFSPFGGSPVGGQFSRLAGQANIFSNVFKNFPNDIPQFSDWIASGINKSISIFKPSSSSDLTIENLESGKSKIAIQEEIPTSIDTLVQAEALDAPSEALAQEGSLSPSFVKTTEGEQGEIIINDSNFTLFENRLSVVETGLEEQSEFVNSELSIQKKTILGVIETLFGIAKLVPTHPISTIVVQGQPATLTTYSVAPQVQSGFDRLSATYLSLANDAVINGSLTVKSGGSFNSLSVSGNTTLGALSLASLTASGDIVIGGTLAVTSTTTVNDLVVNGSLNVPGSIALGNASTTSGTIINFWSTNGTITNASTTYATLPTFWGTNGNVTNLTVTNGTIANASTTYATLPTFWGTNGTIDNLTNINLTNTNASSTNLTATNFWSTNAKITGGTITNASTTYLTVSDSLFGGNLLVGNATTTGLTVNGGTQLGSLAATDAVINGPLTVGGNNFTVTTAGAASSTSLTTSGNVSVGENLTVFGTTNIGSVSLITASSTYLTVSDTAWLNNLVATNATTTTFRSSGLATFGGNVGIGTTTPGNLLSVNSTGNVYFGGNLTVSGTANLQNIITQSGSGQVTFTGNVDATSGLDITNANLTVGGNNFVVTTAGAASSTSLTVSGNSIFNNSSTTNGTITNLWSMNGMIANASSTNLTATNLWGTGLTFTSGTITSASTTNLTGTNFWSTKGTITSASSTYLTVSDTAWIKDLTVSGNSIFNNASTTNGTIANLWSTNGTIANASSTNLTATNFWSTNGTITNLFQTNASSTYLTVSNTAWLNNLVATNATTTTFRSSGLATFGGNVGIGTTTPSAKLSIQGDEYLYGNLTVTGTSGVGSNLTVTGQTFLSDGTISGPSLAFTSDTNTGIYKPGSHIFGFVTDGTERMRIAADGNIGIGTTTTSYAQVNIANNLAVLGTNSSLFNGLVQFSGVPSGTNINQGSVYINPASSAALTNVLFGVAVNGAEKARINAEGDVQITGYYTSTNTTATNQLSGHLSVLNNTTLGDASSDTITLNGSIASNIIPSADMNYNIGTPALRFANIYANNLIATTTTVWGTASSTFVINNANITNDAEDSSLQFSRGTASSNAIIKWDSVNKRFDFNSFPVKFQSNILVNGAASSTFAGPVWFTGTPQGAATSSAVVYINPSTSNIGDNLFDIAVAGNERFRVNAEGNTYIWGSLNISNTISTLAASNILVFGNPIQINGNAIKDSGGTTRLAIGATNAITGNLTVSQNLGAATTTTTYPLTVQGNSYLYGNLTVTGNANLGSASSTYLTVSDTAWLNNLVATNATTTTFRSSGLATFGGNVGIGTTNPSAQLDVNGSAEFNGVLTATSSVYLATVGGNVGIGTSPGSGYKLHVVGATMQELPTDIGSYIKTTGTNNAAYLRIQSGNGTTSGKYAYVLLESLETTPQRWDFGMRGNARFAIVDTTAGVTTERVSVLNTGNVGIGTTAPGYKLTVQVPSNTGQTGVFTDGTRKVGIYTGSASQDWTSIGTISNHNFRLYTNDTDVMTLTTGGNVGIGTTGPGYKLDVQGIGSFGDYARASYFTATSTAFSSTFPNASSTNLTATNFWGTTGIVTNLNSSNVSITGGTITGITDLAVADGGTGASTLTGILQGNGTNAFTASSTVSVTSGGTGASTLLDHGVLVGSGTGAITPLTVGTNGQLLIGSTTADPVFATLNCANGLTCTIGAGTLQIDFDGGDSPAGELGGTWASPTIDDLFIKNTGDIGTGSYTFPNASSTNLTATNFWSTTGNIGTLTLTNDLTVANGGTGAGTLTGLLQGNGTGAITGVTGIVGQIPYYNGTNTLLATSTIYLSTTGNVGIGTTNPTAKLLVNGGATSPATNWTMIVDPYNNAGSGPSVLLGGSSGVAAVQAGANTALALNPTGGNVGIGTTVPGAKLDIQSPSTATSAFNYNQYNLLNASPSSASTGSYVGIRSNVSLATVNNITGGAYGVYGDILNNNTGTLSDAFGIYGYSRNYTTGTITRAYGVYGITGNQNVSGIIGSSYSLYGANPIKAAGTITTAYGLYLEDITNGATNYGIYSAGGTNYLAGNVGIGTTNPEELLQVGINAAGLSTSRRAITLSSGGFGAPGNLYANSNGDKIILYNQATGNAGDMRIGVGVEGDMWFKASSVIRWLTDNSGTMTERMRISNTGNVGIGTTGPGGRLDIHGVSTGTGINTQWADSTGAAKVSILDNGNVGIGTTGPSGKLTVYGSTATLSRVESSGANAYFQAVDNGGSGYYGVESGNMLIQASTAGKDIQFWSNAAQRMVINGTSGNVGIGTTGPQAKLSLGTGIGAKLLLYDNGTGINNGFFLDTPNANDVTLTAHASGAIVFGKTTSAATPTFGTEFMRITNSGNVGIGVTSPDTTLEVRNPNLATDTVNTSLTQRWSRAQTDSVKWGNSMDLLLGSYESGTINSRTRVDFKLAHGATDDPDTTVMTLQSNGNVGIGTTAPGGRLDIHGVSTGTGINTQWADSTGAAKVSILDNGNVGIGTTGADTKLHVNGGNIRISADTTSGNFADFGIGSGNLNINNSYYGAVGPYGGINLITSGTSRVFIKSDGNVGIGTTAPGAKLDIAVTGSALSGLRVRNTDAPTVAGGQAVIDTGFSDSRRIVISAAADSGVGTPYNGFNYINSVGKPLTILDNSGTNVMTLNNGNVGIGTTSPAEKLEIVGNVEAGVSGKIGFRYSSGDSRMFDYMTIAPSGGLGFNGGTFASSHTQEAFNFTTQYSTAALSINNDGNVGIGTTDPRAKLDFGNAASFPADLIGLWDSGASVRYGMGIDTAGGGTPGSTGGLVFYSGDRGFDFRGSNISGTSKMMITSSGNVGIGTTTPRGNLELYGTNYASLLFSSTQVGVASRDWAIATDGYSLAGAFEIRKSDAKDGNPLSAGSAVLLIDNLGNVGIGTTAPRQILDVIGTGIFSGNVGIGTTTPREKLDVVGNIKSSGIYPYILLAPPGWNSYINAGVDAVGTASNANFTTFLNPTGKGFSFSINNSSKLIVNTAGSVGIGTTSPGAKLDVADGNLILTDADITHGMTIIDPTNAFGTLKATSGTNGGLSIAGYTDTDAQALSLYGIIGADPVDATPAVKFYAGKANGTNWSSLAPTETAFQFNNYSSDLVTILGNGNVGIGTTAPGAPLDVFTSTNVWGAVFGNRAAGTNLRISGTAGAGVNYGLISVYSGSGESTYRDLVLQRDGGNVGIGTTGPGYKLDVQGIGSFGDYARASYFTATSTAFSSTFPNASSTNLTATNFWSTTGNIGTLTLTNDLTVANGGTGAGTLTGLLQGNGTGAITGVTGIVGQIPYYNGTNTLLATSTIYLSTTGNVGIGTTGPGQLLEVSSTGTYTDARITAGSNPGIELYSTNADGSARNWRIGAASNAHGDFAIMQSNAKDGIPKSSTGTYRLYIQNDGNVGIGTTAPGGRLDIHGVSTGTGINTQWADSTGAAKVSILDNGNVGIGTTAPARKLHVFGDANGAELFITGSVNTQEISQSFIPTGALSASNMSWTVGRAYNANAFSIRSYDGTTDANRLYINNSGNVGIGTTGPGTPLDVRIPYAKTDTSLRGGISLLTNDATNPAGLDIYLTGHASAQASRTVTIQTSEHNVVNSGNLALQPYGGNVGIGTTAPRQILDVIGTGIFSGNVGIGTTGPGNKLSVNGNASFGLTDNTYAGTTIYGGLEFPRSGIMFSNTNSQNQLFLMSNAYIGGSNTYLYRSTAVTAGIGIDDGTVTFFTDASGTAGAAVPMSTRMIILNTGNIGIGTTAPGGRLDIHGVSTGTGINTQWADSTGAAKVSILDNGNVGIGTTAPGALLHIYGGDAGADPAWVVEDKEIIEGSGDAYLQFFTPTNHQSGLEFSDTTRARGWVIYDHGQTFTDALIFGTAGAQQMIITSGGNVGIGTTAPGGRLDIHGVSTGTGINTQWADSTGAAKVSILDNGNVGIGTTGPGAPLHVKGISIVGNPTWGNIQAIFEDSGGDYPGIAFQGTSGLHALIRSEGGDGLSFATFANGASGGIKLRILENGNVGIGTTMPISPLSIGSRVMGAITSTNGIYLGSRGFDQWNRIIYTDYDGNTDVGASISSYFNSTSLYGILSLGTVGYSGVEQTLNIKQGNVGIGTTAPRQILDVIGTGIFSGNVGIGTTAPRQILDVIGTGIFSGNVGIGTTNPGNKLHIFGGKTLIDSTDASYSQLQIGNSTSGGEAGITFIPGVTTYGGTPVSANGDTSIWVLGANIYGIGSTKFGIGNKGLAGNMAVTVLSTGNVGIGTTGPATTLHVLSASAEAVRIAYNSTLSTRMGTRSDGNFQLYAYDSAGAYKNILLAIDGSTPAGSVGIGIAGPGKKLEVYEDNAATTSTTGILVTNSSLIANARAGIVFKNYDNYGAAIWSPRTGGTAGRLFFGTNGSGAIAETGVSAQMVINELGNVGIGTTNPVFSTEIKGASGVSNLFRLETNDFNTNVAGSGLSVHTGASSGNTYTEITAFTSGYGATGNLVLNSAGGNVGIGTTGPTYKLHVHNTADARLHLSDDTSGSGASDGSYLRQSGVDTSLVNMENGLLQFGTNNDYKMTILSNGNVGIGTTTPGQTLSVAGGIRVSQTAGVGRGLGIELSDRITGAGQSIGWNIYFDGAAWKYRNSDYGGSFEFNNTGDYSFVSLASGTPGATLDWTNSTKLIIKNSGNVGIGTTAPGGRLDIHGVSTGTGINTQWADSTGAAKVSILDNGNVGIGTTGPGQLLEVSSTGTYTDARITAGSNPGIELYSTNADGSARNWRIGAASNAHGDFAIMQSNAKDGIPKSSTGTYRLYIQNDGNVGIGTTAPGGRLDIHGVSTGTGINTQWADSTGAAKVSILDNGNIGIGTTNPTARLTVSSTNQITNSNEGGNLILSTTDSQAIDVGPQLRFSGVNGRGDEYGTFAFGTIAGRKENGTSGTFNGYLQFSTTNTYGSILEAMRINSGGNVGIGTTAPGAKLDIAVTGSALSGLRVRNTDAPTVAGGQAVIDTGFSDSRRIVISAAADSGVGTPYNGFNYINSVGKPLTILDNSGTNVMTLNNGNVGIGTTAPGVKLDIGGTNNTYFLQNSGATTGYAAAIIQNTGTNIQFGVSTSGGSFWPTGVPASYYATIGTNNATPLVFATNNSGRMVIDSNGNVGIGTTNPGYKLTVQVPSNTGQTGVFTDGTRKVGIYTGTAGQDWTSIGTISNHNFRLYTNDTDVMTLTTTGNVGIGTTGPHNRLEVLGINAAPLASGSSESGGLRVTGATTVVMDFGVYGAGDYSWIQSRNRDSYSTNYNLLLNPNGGSVGVGTTTPTTNLTVSLAGTTANVAVTKGWLCVDNDGGCIGGTAGTVYFRASATGGSDIAENYDSQKQLEAGDIVMALGGKNIEKATTTSSTIIGIISTQPGSLLGYDEANASSSYPVALSGRVPVKVSLENGPIAIGDRISASSVPGIGMRSSASTTSITVGMALEAFDGWSPSTGSGQSEYSQIGKVLVFVNLGQPQLAAKQGTIELAALNSDLNLNGFSILNIKSITGMNGLWKIDENGNITAQSINTQALTVGGGNASGITIYDRQTSAPKCIYIEGGAIMASDGACGAAAAPSSMSDIGETLMSDIIPGTATTTPPVVEEPLVATTTPEMIPTATTTPEILPTVEPTATTTP